MQRSLFQGERRLVKRAANRYRIYFQAYPDRRLPRAWVGVESGGFPGWFGAPPIGSSEEEPREERLCFQQHLGFFPQKSTFSGAACPRRTLSVPDDSERRGPASCRQEKGLSVSGRQALRTSL